MLALESYTYFTNVAGYDYEFESIGKKGIIKKIARFSKIGDPLIYNFGFGDLDENTGEINDNVASNNGDQEKILNTLATIIFDFSILYSEAQIYIEGTSLVKTRLYQINIGKYWNKIETIFEVFGLKDNKWHSFQKGINYEAFIGMRK